MALLNINYYQWIQMPSEFNNLLLTEDGSITCRDQESGELYHNKAGAYSEALHHYIRVCDLTDRTNKQDNITVLDVCFGLGYNTFVFIDQLIEHIEKGDVKQEQINCHIVGIDKDPEILAVVLDVLKDPRFKRLCVALDLSAQSIKNMLASWKVGGPYTLQFNGKVKLTAEIEIKIDDIRQILPKIAENKNHFDYIFHDGFSPRSMPELWTADLFAQYVKMLNPDGRIITYSAATAVRGGLKECGLEIRKSAPLGRKSGGTIAFHSQNTEIINGSSILHLNNDENLRLSSRSAIPYRDPNLNNSRAQIIKQRALEIEQSPLPVYDRTNN